MIKFSTFGEVFDICVLDSFWHFRLDGFPWRKQFFAQCEPSMWRWRCFYFSWMNVSNISLSFVVAVLNYARMRHFPSPFFSPPLSDYRNVIWLINFQNIWLTWAEGKGEKIIFPLLFVAMKRKKKSAEEKILFGILSSEKNEAAEEEKKTLRRGNWKWKQRRSSCIFVALGRPKP